MNTVIGHEAIQQFFDRVIAAGQLSHAYIFAGPEHVGKYTYACALAGAVFRVAPDVVYRHPDFFVVRQEQDEKTQKTKKNIDIDQIRDVRAALSSRSMHGGYKVAIIDGAHAMSTSAANALLKTLEEPRGQTLIILVTSHAEALPQTIRSRAQTIRFGLVEEPSLVAYATAHGLGASEAASMAHAALGRPGTLASWITDPALYHEYHDAREQFFALVNKPFYEKRKHVAAWFGDSEDHIAARQGIAKSLNLWRVLIREEVRAYFGQSIDNAKTSWNPQAMVLADRAICFALEYLDRNINPRLLVEHVLLSLP